MVLHPLPQSLTTASSRRVTLASSSLNMETEVPAVLSYAFIWSEKQSTTYRIYN